MNDNYYNCYPKCDNYYYFDNDYNYICLNETKCSNNEYKYLIEEKKQCVNNCTKYSEYKYHFRNKCYDKCPGNISNKSETKDYFCESICSRELPYELIESQLCVNNCTIKQINNKKCKLNFKANDRNETYTVQEKMVEDVKEEIVNGLDTTEVDKGKDIIIEDISPENHPTGQKEMA